MLRRKTKSWVVGSSVLQYTEGLNKRGKKIKKTHFGQKKTKNNREGTYLYVLVIE